MTNGFTKKSVGTLTLGEKLKRLRSEKRISLGEASRYTKIQVAYLEYLEEGSYDRLPADVYVRGFLRSYADFLGVDESILLKLYNKERGIKKNLEKNNNAKPVKKKPVNISSYVLTPKKIIAVVATVSVLAGLYFLYREIDSFASAPSLVIIAPESESEISGNSIFVEGITDSDAALFINGQPILVNDDGRFRENLTLQPGLNVINIKAVNKFEKEISKSISVSSTYADIKNEPQSEGDPAQAAEGGDPAAENDELKVDLRVDPGPVWLSVEADGQLVFSGTMLSGAIQSFKAQEQIIINSGKGDATFVTFKGKDIGPLSQDSGAVRGVTFNKDTQY